MKSERECCLRPVAEIGKGEGHVGAGRQRAPSGAWLVWLIADLDRCFARDESAEHALILTNAVRWALDGRQRVEIGGGHGAVTADLHRQEGRHILHLNNRLLLSRVPGRQYGIVPLGPIELRLRTGVPTEAVRLRVRGGDVPFERVGDGVRFTIDELRGGRGRT